MSGKGCLNEGEYKLQNHQTVRKIFFLLDHIKIYNKRWNYFAGKVKNKYDFKKMISLKADQQDHFHGYGSKIKFEFEYNLDHEKLNSKKE